MLQGVHAETIVFTVYQQARGSVLDPNRPLLGTAREVRLDETPRRFRMRTREVRESGKALTCQLELHDRGRPLATLMRLGITFAPDGRNTRVKLRGSTVRDLTPASPNQDDRSRRLANTYARALLEDIARELEARATNSTRVEERATPVAVTHKRR